MNDPVATVLGVGPGLGSSVARRFARGGYRVALMARSTDKLHEHRETIEGEGGTAVVVGCDATEPDSVASAFDETRRRLGDPEVLVYNAGAFQHSGIMEIDPSSFLHCWKVNCFGGFLAAREVLPAMVESGEGTVLFTGATGSLRGSAKFANLAVGKFGLRALAQSMAREFGPRGIHVAHVIIDGQINLPRTREAQPERDEDSFLDPDAIAENYWRLHTQDKTTWTLELDLRPYVEEF